ncbi:AC3 protein [Lycianthes yellow mosaic virus]|uniref:Replication enhancer n=1 Tax=Lycianthes yellow mosaic virus TaxID=1779714 RepID=A0A140D6R1_9GEMI|nr:AC3 protein [Lycianthes yellow mosaic virus]AMK07577.1 AC3 protein [Lycianthes yellow mosaic virus]
MAVDFRTGEYITATQAQNGAYIWTVPNPLYFKVLKHTSRPFNSDHDYLEIQIQFNHNLRRALGIHKCFLIFRIWTRLRPQTWRFLRVFKYNVIRFLNNLGVVSINNVIRSVNHVLWNVFDNTTYARMLYAIKFNIY